MKRFEADTLEEACRKAAEAFTCTVADLKYDIIQYPKRGFLGFFAKSAIIIATKRFMEEKVTTPDTQKISEKIDSKSKSKELKRSDKKSVSEKEPLQQSSEIVDSFFDNSKRSRKTQGIDAPDLEKKIKTLLSHSCFDIDTVEVDIEDNTAFVFIDGEDAALLIGKEGYRYNALSYILFNWINVEYGLYLKLEIAQFLASQQDMIKNQLQPVVEHVSREGWGRTRELNGILVQIALEYLRGRFPNKYVAIKRNKNGERYIVINEFNKK